jgi:hypothetical protein
MVSAKTISTAPPGALANGPSSALASRRRGTHAQFRVRHRSPADAEGPSAFAAMASPGSRPLATTWLPNQ